MRRTLSLVLPLAAAGGLLLSALPSLQKADQGVCYGQAPSKDIQGQKDRKDQLVLGMVWEPVSFNPLRGIDSGSYCASSFVYEGLVKFDQNQHVVGGLAESFKVSTDGLEYDFVLRKGLRFSTGQALKASDVRASLLIGASKISPFAGDYRDIIAVDIADDRHLTVRLSRPCQPLLSRMAELRIVPEQILNSKDHGNSILARTPIATGAYQLKSWQAGQELVFERNPYYWGAPAATAQIVWRVIPDKMALAAAIGRREVDLAPVDGRVWENYLAKKAGKFLDMCEFNGGRTIYFGFNLERAPWTDKRVREAFACAIDRGAIVRSLYGGHAVVPDTDVPLTSWAHIDDVRHVSFDPERARRLLIDAGFKYSKDGPYQGWWRDQKRLALRVMTIKDLEEVAQVVADYLKRIDVACEVEVIEYSTLRRSFMSKGRFDAVVWSRSFGPDPECTLVWGTKGPLNFCRLSDPKVDQWLKDARTAPDQKQRKVVYARLQNYLANELPWVFIAQPKQIIAFKRGISGITGIQKDRQKINAGLASDAGLSIEPGLPWDNIATNASTWLNK